MDTTFWIPVTITNKYFRSILFSNCCSRMINFTYNDTLVGYAVFWYFNCEISLLRNVLVAQNSFLTNHKHNIPRLDNYFSKHVCGILDSIYAWWVYFFVHWIQNFDTLKLNSFLKANVSCTYNLYKIQSWIICLDYSEYFQKMFEMIFITHYKRNNSL